MRITVNFQCKKCTQSFDCNIGNIQFTPSTGNPIFEKSVLCPTCGKLDKGDYILTEIGQSELTELFINT
jgi:hypothetical protein